MLVTATWVGACNNDVGTVFETPPGFPDASTADAKAESTADDVTGVVDANPEAQRRVPEAAPLCRDQSNDGGNGEVVSSGLTIADVLTGVSPDCLACARVRCAISLAACGELSGCATGGPAKGMSRSSLCAETVQCLSAMGCFKVNMETCVCRDFAREELGEAAGTLRCSYYLNTRCVPTLERAAESDSVDDILNVPREVTQGAGAAGLLLQCLQDQHCTSCLPPVDAGVADAARPD